MQLVWVVLINILIISASDDTCSVDNCPLSKQQIKYILYDVNRPEGFNLRRDVYMRLAIFVKKLNERNSNWKLVLPPWPTMYHWTSRVKQKFIPWSKFFQVESMQRFAPVIEMLQFFQDVGKQNIDNIFILKHYKEAFSKDWNWDDKWEISKCDDEDYISGWFLGYSNFTIKNVNCLSFQGGASFIENILKNYPGRITAIDHAEIALHDNFGDKTYWECRRSMRFSSHLIQEAKKFRKKYLNSTDINDGTEMTTKWEDNPRGIPIGGPYISIHMRRKDFLYDPKRAPSIKEIATQINPIIKKLKVSTLFLATDGTEKEINKLKELLTGVSVVVYKQTKERINTFLDGGIAIIDQIICSHAKYFIGTKDSTFTYRIQEEREIMGFPSETTFDILCSDEKTCSEKLVWKIVV